MTDFVGRDPRQHYVHLSPKVWDHAEQHHAALGGKYGILLTTLRTPTLILDNPGRPGLNRIALERYCYFSSELETYVVVPVRILSAPERAQGYGTIPVETRSAVTAYASAGIPRGGVIWRST